MNLAAGGAGKAPVHLGDHDFGGLGCGLGVVSRETVAAKTLLIGRRYLHQHYVYGQDFAFEEARNFGEEARSKCAAAFLDGFSGGRAQEEPIKAKAVFHPGLGESGGAHRDHVHDFHVVKLRSARYQGLNQHRGFTTGVSQYDAIPGLDRQKGLSGGNELFFVGGSPILREEGFIFRESLGFCGHSGRRKHRYSPVTGNSNG